jgi:Fic family protein
MIYIWNQKEWPYFKWESDELIDLLGKARYKQGLLISQVNSLGLELSVEARSKILISEALTTSAIEGLKLDDISVRSSVAKRLGLPTAGLKPPGRDADGLVEVLIDATNNYDKPLTKKRIMGWQAALFPTGYSGIKQIKVGKWRGKDPMKVVSGPIGKEKIHFEAPPNEQIDSEMKRFIYWWEKDSKQYDGLLRAGIAHLYFVTIHPFEDGNGRIARAITDMALAQDEKMSSRFYSLSASILKDKNEYYDILESTQKSNLDITRWLVWFLKCFSKALDDSHDTILLVINKAKFWQKHAQALLNKRQQKVINKLLDLGPGGFAGGLTTRKYVAMTKTSRVTAFREILDLLNKNILKAREKKGRSTSYDLKIED